MHAMTYVAIFGWKIGYIEREKNTYIYIQVVYRTNVVQSAMHDYTVAGIANFELGLWLGSLIKLMVINKTLQTV